MPAPVNALVLERATPDTLRCSGWLDLAREPVVLSVPDAGGRYYALWLRDATGTVFASIGPRTTGTGRRAFVAMGPGQHAVHPWPGLTPIAAATRTAQIDGRIEAVGERDADAVGRLHAGFRLSPLSGWRDPVPPLDDVEGMDPGASVTRVLHPGWTQDTGDPTADAVHLRAETDAERRPLSGGHRYVLRFAPDSLPSVHGFWELTAGACSIGDRHPLALDADGALAVHIQHAPPPRAMRWNWLPAPDGPIRVALHLYWPRDETWSPPPLTRL